MRVISTLCILILVLFCCAASGADIDGRLGLTGKVGAIVPLKDDFISMTSGANPDIALGGGLIYGIGKNFAAELDVSHASGIHVDISGNKVFDASLTDYSLGVQFRLNPDNHCVPFLGAGVDFIKGDLAGLSGTKYDLDWTYGGHVNVGFDYFITRGIVFLADFKGIFAGSGDIMKESAKVGEYNPVSFVGTVGFRLFWPENAFN